MKRAICRILVIWIVLISVTQPKLTTGTQAKPDLSNAYVLGVYLGLASFQLQVGEEAFGSVRAALLDARSTAESLKSTVPPLVLDNLEYFSQEFMNASWDPASHKSFIAEALPRLVNLRGEYSGILQQFSKPMGQAYDLGVAIAIAEAQATAGEPARDIVRSSLQNSVSPAQGLGLPAIELNTIIQQIDQGAPLDGIYGEITSLRGKYLGILLAYKPPTVAGSNGPGLSTVATVASANVTLSKGGTAIKAPSGGSLPNVKDQLVSLGCSQVTGKPGGISCPTVQGYETCQYYQKKGELKITSCSTTANLSRYTNIEKELTAQGCSNFLGRAGEYLCQTLKGAQACRDYMKKGDGLVTRCLSVKDAEMTQDLKKHGCYSFLGREGEYMCPTTDGFKTCENYRIDGRLKICRQPKTK